MSPPVLAARAVDHPLTEGDPKGRNLAWSYERTLPDSGQLQDLVAFFDERADVVVDGRRRKTGSTPWT